MRSLVACCCALVIGCTGSPTGGPGEASGGSAGDGDGGSETSLGGELNSSGGETNGVGGETVTHSGGADSSGGETSVATGGSDDGSGGESSGGAASGGASSGGTSSGGSGAGGSPPVDSDGDGVPDSIDQCPGGDDLQDLNENGEIDECEPGWCHKSNDPEKSLCSVTYGVRQGYCTMETVTGHGMVDIEPGQCVQCTTYTYDCNDDWSDGCETWSTGAHPCFPDGL